MLATEHYVLDNRRWLPGIRGHDSYTSVSTSTAGSYYLADPPSAAARRVFVSYDPCDLAESLAAKKAQFVAQVDRAQREIANLSFYAPSGAGNEWLSTKVATAKIAVRSWMSKAPAQREAIGERLLDLIDAAAEDHPEIEVPNQVVLGAVFKFFESEHGLSRPKLTLTPPGGVWAQWRQGDDRAVGLHFKADGVNLIASVPRPGALFRTASFADSVNWQLALARLRDDRLFAWTHTAAGG